MSAITLEAATEVLVALSDDDEDRVAHLRDVLSAVGEAYLSPIIDATDDDFPDSATEAAFLNVAGWADQAASDLDGLLAYVESGRQNPLKVSDPVRTVQP